ncbi:MAG: nickel-dependent lactate racemase [Kiritimatiellae bacterium]|nr:nickel-dependent lactate racemase [Kiritimatiellia bacterium]
MTNVDIPYARTHLQAEIPDENLMGVFSGGVQRAEDEPSQSERVKLAMEAPTGSPPLEELVKNKHNMVVITSDHTRPVPSRTIMPLILEEARQGNPEIEITILVATGFHRATTRAELVDKLGLEIVENENIVVHDSRNASELVRLDDLPSGGELWLNRLAVETDLLIAEGFIEPHFFAGFSGGRKSVLPGVAGASTVLANHCAEFISSPQACTGSLENNPIHRDMIFAAEQVNLAYIVNVVIDADKRVVKAFAGHFEAAHLAGCRFLGELVGIEVPAADIVITSNGGYPLDQNIYQAVKGMTAAEAAVKKGGVIIMVAACNDGHGGLSFYTHMAVADSPAAVLEKVAGIPRNQTLPDQWEFQILARILNRNTVIMVTDQCDAQMIKQMHMQHAVNLDEALGMAFELQGQSATVTVIPDGVSVIVKKR